MTDTTCLTCGVSHTFDQVECNVKHLRERLQREVAERARLRVMIDLCDEHIRALERAIWLITNPQNVQQRPRRRLCRVCGRETRDFAGDSPQCASHTAAGKIVVRDKKTGVIREVTRDSVDANGRNLIDVLTDVHNYFRENP